MNIRTRMQWPMLLTCALLAPSVFAVSAPELQASLEARFKGDRTGACVVAAVIEAGGVTRARACAQTREDGGPGYDSLFEIGSVTKTMTAALVAELIRQGTWSLDDPLARHLPPGTVVPRQGERQILVRDVLTHRSGLPGLPPGFAPRNPADPYASLDEATLLAALGKVELTRPIGSQFEYSNFAMMVMSMAVAHAMGGDYEQALVTQLFEPLQMRSAYINKPRAAALAAQGHLPTGVVTPAWHAAGNLAGVGMVRASLVDMVRYAQAELGLEKGVPPGLQADLRLTQQPLVENTGMNWMLFNVGERGIVAHEGGTGGFSSLVALEPDAKRAVVILADTSLTDLGGLGNVGNALLGVGAPSLKPRLAAAPDAVLLAAMSGDYLLGALHVRIWADGKTLMAQADGQSAFELKYDSAGDFYPANFDALLTPRLANSKVDTALWRQGGGVMVLTRQQLSDDKPAQADPRWNDLFGDYALRPQFHLRVFEERGALKVQATGQPAIGAEMTGPDRIEIQLVGAVVEFKRDANGKVNAAVLKQGGHEMEGARQ